MVDYPLPLIPFFFFRCISIYFFHIHKGPWSGHLPSGFHQSPVRVSVLLTHHIPYPSHPRWFDRPNNIWWAVQITKLLIMQFSSDTCYFIPLRPQHPVLHRFQPVFLPHCKRPSFTHIQNNRQNFSFVCFIFMLSDMHHTGRQKTLDPTPAGTLWIYVFSGTQY